jgi:phosphatidylglycerophosphatase A
MAMANKQADIRSFGFSRFIATGFFSGYIPWASGTFGTLVSLFFFLIPGFSHPLVLSTAIAICFFLGAFTANRVAQVEGHRLTKSARQAKHTFQDGKHSTPDPSIVVIDEMLGMWIAMLAIPLSFVSIVIAFLAFRVFDIVKPFPARQLESVPNGWGIMLDDVVAGVYANIVARILITILLQFFPHLF